MGSDCILLAVRGCGAAQEALSLMLEWRLLPNEEARLQFVNALESTDSGKERYAALCQRQKNLHELVSESAEDPLARSADDAEKLAALCVVRVSAGDRERIRENSRDGIRITRIKQAVPPGLSRLSRRFSSLATLLRRDVYNRDAIFCSIRYINIIRRVNSVSRPRSFNSDRISKCSSRRAGPGN